MTERTGETEAGTGGCSSSTRTVCPLRADKDVVLVPKNYESYCGAAAEQLQQFGEHKKLIRCGYEMDEGSFLYLEERIRRAQEEKPI